MEINDWNCFYGKALRNAGQNQFYKKEMKKKML